jgi:hypothetical protein
MNGYYTYPNEPIGNGNPYYCCCSCGRSDPEINGRLSGHYDWCKWAIEKRKELNIQENQKEDL